MSPRGAAATEALRRRSRRRILAASLRVFSHKGFHGASMEAIANAAGVSKGLPYLYFATKEDLLLATLQGRLAHFEELVTEVGGARGSARERLALLVDRLLGHVAGDPQVFRLHLMLSLDEALQPLFRRKLAAAREPLERYLRQIRDLLEEVGSTDPDTDAVLLRSALLGILLRLVRGAEEVPLQALRTRLLDLFDTQIGAGRGKEGS